MMDLNPTLWRTCRMLAGEKRIELLRELHREPGRSVAALGKAVGISRSDASQELRRIQSRGLLKSERQGLPLIYRMEADPQVFSAGPLLRAIRSALSSLPSEEDRRMCILSNGLAHVRRISILHTLFPGPQPMRDLPQHLHMSSSSFWDHMTILVNCGWITRKGDSLHLQTIRHPLARALVLQLRQNDTA